MAKSKICGITNLEDAIFAAGCGSHALGFNFYPRSPRYITPENAGQIISHLPRRVLKVGVFVNEPLDSIARIAEISGLTAIQLHGDEGPEFIADTKRITGLPVIKAARVAAGFDASSVLQYGADAILLDTYSASEYGGTGETFNWDLALEVQKIFPKVYLAGGLSPENVQRAVLTARPYAVDACSLLESEKGRKDQDAVKRFIENCEGPDLSRSAELGLFIKERLLFLTESYGFRVVKETVNFNVVEIKYESKNVKIWASCFLPRADYDIWFRRNTWLRDIGKNEAKYEMPDLIKALGLSVSFVPGADFENQSSEKSAIEKIGWDAEILENYGAAVLRGDREIYKRLSENK